MKLKWLKGRYYVQLSTMFISLKIVQLLESIYLFIYHLFLFQSLAFFYTQIINYLNLYGF